MSGQGVAVNATDQEGGEMRRMNDVPDRWPPDPDMLDRLRAANERAAGARMEAQVRHEEEQRSRRYTLRVAIEEAMSALGAMRHAQLDEIDRNNYNDAVSAVARAHSAAKKV